MILFSRCQKYMCSIGVSTLVRFYVCLMRASTDGKTHGVVIFLLFIKTNIIFDDAILYKARAYSYAKGHYGTFKRLE